MADAGRLPTNDLRSVAQTFGKSAQITTNTTTSLLALFGANTVIRVFQVDISTSSTTGIVDVQFTDGTSIAVLDSSAGSSVLNVKTLRTSAVNLGLQVVTTGTTGTTSIHYGYTPINTAIVN